MIGLVAATETLPRPAPLDARFSAFLLDGLILFVVAFPTWMWSFVTAPFDVALWFLGILDVAYSVYFAAFWSFGHTDAGHARTTASSRRWKWSRPRFRPCACQ